MKTNQPSELTRKGAQTRERLLDAALKLFVEKGYEATTMRDIAAATESSLGLTYRYFASKDELVLALYARLAAEVEQEARGLPPAPLAERFERATQLKLARMAPYRDVFGAILGAILTPRSSVAVLGDHTIDLQRQARETTLMLVTGAMDAPRGRQAQDLANVLYAGQLLLLLFWLHDRSPQARATYDLLAISRTMLNLGRRLLRLPPVTRTLARLAETIAVVFDPDSSPEVR
jgi:AcrR family transcriptional regulator